MANVTLVHGPGTFPDFGLVPAGGLGRKRLNLDGIVVQGLEIGTQVRFGNSVTMSAEYLFSDVRVRDGDPDRSLDGKQIPQVPRHSATLSLDWHGPGGLQVAPRLRVFSLQFEDDENLLPLAGAVVADLRISVPLGKSATIFLLGENLGDTRIETGKSSAGVTSTGTPRIVTAGVDIGL